MNQCWNTVNWPLRNKLQWHLNRNSYIFIKENAFENIVRKMEAILFRPQCDELLNRNEFLLYIIYVNVYVWISVSFFHSAFTFCSVNQNMNAILANAVRCCYNAVNFLQILIKRTPKLAREGEIWGVFSEFNVWLTFCHFHSSVECNIVTNVSPL